jgi:galactokinase/mevalonate kinase-like predicted kinase
VKVLLPELRFKKPRLRPVKMILMDTESVQFVQCLDIAISTTEDARDKLIDSLILEHANQTVEVMKNFRELAISGKLPRPSKGDVPPGTGLGLGRSVGEWSQSDTLLDAVYAVERYYREVL